MTRRIPLRQPTPPRTNVKVATKPKSGGGSRTARPRRPGRRGYLGLALALYGLYELARPSGAQAAQPGSAGECPGQTPDAAPPPSDRIEQGVNLFSNLSTLLSFVGTWSNAGPWATRIGNWGQAGSRFAGPLQVALGLGQYLGDTIADIRDGTFFSPDGRLSQRVEQTLQDSMDVFDPDKWKEDPLNQAMNTLNLLNPVTAANNIGAGGVKLGQEGYNAVIDLATEHNDLTRLESTSNIGKHFEAQQKIQEMIRRRNYQQGMEGKPPTINPFEFSQIGLKPNEGPLKTAGRTALHIVSKPTGIIDAASEAHTSWSTLRGQTMGAAQAFEQNVGGDPNKPAAQRVMEKANLGVKDRVVYMTMGHSIATPRQLLSGEALNPVTGRRMQLGNLFGLWGD
jgi:hypothetical protein